MVTRPLPIDVPASAAEQQEQLQQLQHDLENVTEQCQSARDEQAGRYDSWLENENINHGNTSYDDVPGHEEMRGLEEIGEELSSIGPQIESVRQVLDSLQGNQVPALQSGVLSTTEEVLWELEDAVTQARRRIDSLSL